jgi:hypothetical protein
MLEIFVIILDLQATITIRIGFGGTLSFLWILLGQHFYTCHLSVGGPFGMVFKHLRDLFDLEDSTSGFIQPTSCVPMWLLAASLGAWFEFLGLVHFWLWLNFLVAFIRL